MASPAHEIPELDRLLDGLVWNELSSGQVSRLEELLIADEAARNYYRTYLGLHVMLEASSTQVPSVHLPPLEQIESALSSDSPILGTNRPQDNPGPWLTVPPAQASGVLGFLGDILHAAYSSPRTTVMVLGGALAGYFIGLFALIPLARLANDMRPAAVAENPLEPQTAPSIAKRKRDVGSLTTDKLARWRPDAAPTRPIVELGKRYELADGTADIYLARGTRVVIQAPAAWNFDSEQRLLLFSGRLAAQVPRAAIGFTVETPSASIIDLGTEFAVDVDGAGATSLAVLRGTVEISKRAASGAAPAVAQAVRLAAGEAMTVSGPTSDIRMVRPVGVDTSWAKRVLSRGAIAAAAPLVAYSVKPGTAGNQGWFHGALGLDFDVERPIRVFRLGVFDHMGDGIHPESELTVELWSRNPGRLPTPDDDTGIEKLTELTFRADDAGTLVGGHRFKPLAQPLDLPIGAYSVVASGFCDNNPIVNIGLPEAQSPLAFESGGGAIKSVGKSRNDNQFGGDFPRNLDFGPLQYAAGSFEFVPRAGAAGPARGH